MHPVVKLLALHLSNTELQLASLYVVVKRMSLQFIYYSSWH